MPNLYERAQARAAQRGIDDGLTNVAQRLRARRANAEQQDVLTGANSGAISHALFAARATYTDPFTEGLLGEWTPAGIQQRVQRDRSANPMTRVAQGAAGTVGGVAPALAATAAVAASGGGLLPMLAIPALAQTGADVARAVPEGGMDPGEAGIESLRGQALFPIAGIGGGLLGRAVARGAGQAVGAVGGMGALASYDGYRRTYNDALARGETPERAAEMAREAAVSGGVAAVALAPLFHFAASSGSRARATRDPRAVEVLTRERDDVSLLKGDLEDIQAYPRRGSGRVPAELRQRTEPTREPTAPGEYPTDQPRPRPFVDPGATEPSAQQLGPLSVAEMLADALGTRIDVGRTSPGNVAQASRSRRSIRQARRAINNVAHTTHEIGHIIDTDFQISGRARTPAVRQELTDLAEGVIREQYAGESAETIDGIIRQTLAENPDWMTQEGLAQFVSAYVTRPEYARDHAPQYFSLFEGALQETGPGARTLVVLRNARDLLAAYRDLTPMEQVGARVQMHSTDRGDVFGSRPGNFIRNSVDRLHFLTTVEEAIRGGARQARDVPVGQSPTAVMRLHTTIGQRVVDWVQHGVSSWDGTRRAPAMRELYAAIGGPQQMKPFVDYLVARGLVGDARPRGRIDALMEIYHLTERDARRVLRGDVPPVVGDRAPNRLQRVAMEYATNPEFRTRAEARAMARVGRQGIDDPVGLVRQIEEMGTEQFKRGFEIFRQMNEALLDRAVDAGLLSGEQAANMREFYGGEYVPLQRVIQRMIGGSEVESAGGMGGGMPGSLRSRRGESVRDIRNPIAAHINNMGEMETRIQQNRALLAMRELISSNPKVAKQFGLEAGVSPTWRGTEIFRGRIKNFLRENGVDPNDLSINLDEVVRQWEPVFRIDFKDRVVPLYRNGQRELIQMDNPELWRVFFGSPDVPPQWTRLFAWSASTLRAGATKYNPVFAAKNFTRDLLHSLVVGRGWAHDSIIGLFDTVFKTDTYRRWKEQGDFAGIITSFDKDLLDPSWYGRNIEGRSRAGRVAQNMLLPFRYLSETSERAIRVGQYRAWRRFLRKNHRDWTDAEVHERAILESRDIMDFSRHGAETAAWRAMIPFLNANIQGISKVSRELRQRPMWDRGPGVLPRALAHIVAPTMLLYMVNRKDPDYWALSERERATYWHLRVGDGFIRIPKPFQIGYLFGTVPERVMRQVDTQDPEGFEKSMWEHLGDAYSGLFGVGVSGAIPPLAAAGIEHAINHDLFYGRDLYPRYQMYAQWPQAERYRDETPEIARVLGRTFGVSPAVLENYATSLGGGTASFLMGAADAGMAAAREGGSRAREEFREKAFEGVGRRFYIPANR